ncbi:hypothetical protein MZH21_07445, partial [Escherichia coli]|nr:hypothetical protein [Escherichia coli]
VGSITLSDVLNVSEDVIYSDKKQHTKYKIISCSNYKSRKQNSKTIWLNKITKFALRKNFLCTHRPCMS